MLLIKKAVLKGSPIRNYLGSLDDNTISFGNLILNSDYTVTDLSRIFNVWNGDENTTFITKLTLLPSINGCCGTINPENGGGVQRDNSDVYMSDIPLKSTITSSLGPTIGRKFAIHSDCYLYEILENGEPRFIRGPGYRQYVSESRSYFLGETNTYFYIYSISPSNTIGEVTSIIIRVHKLTFALTSFSIPINNTYATKLIRKEGNRFVFALYGANSETVTNNFYYAHLNIDNDQFSNTSAISATAINTSGYGGIVFRISNFTPDRSDMTKLKMYKIGGLTPSSNDYTNIALKVYRFQASKTIDTTEGTNTAVQCTLNNMGSYSIISPTTTNVTNWQTDDSEIAPFVITANSGNEYLFIIAKQYVNNGTRTAIDRQHWSLFTISPTNSLQLTLKQSETRSGFGYAKRFFGILKSWDFKILVIMAADGFFILKFDETTETFIQSQFYPMVYRTMILNDKNELIVQVNDNYTYVFNITTEFSISVDFVNTAPSLDYSGVPFNTDIKVNVFDSIGNRLASTVNLVVENAVFVTSSTTTLSVQTSDTTDTIVSLTVSSAGIVRVTPSI